MTKRFILSSITVVFGVMSLAIILAVGYNALYANGPTDEGDASAAQVAQALQRGTSATKIAAASTTTPEVEKITNTLIIPSIGVRAPIEKVGITKKGTMSVPLSFTTVGLYKFGVAPGKKGSAVIAGHLDNAMGTPGVFNDLNKLHKGDSVFVADAQGNMTRFIVTNMQIFDAVNTPTESIFGKNDKAYLNLITCDGTWVQSLKSYSKRLVVFTELAA